jgi:MoxR-like ATPase
VATVTTSGVLHQIEPVIDGERLRQFQSLVRRVPAPPSVVDYAVRLARSTRPDDPGAPAFVREMIAWGAGPRASQYLVLGCKARAALQGRPAPNLDDVRALAPDVLRHRIVPGFEAEAAGRTPDDLVEDLIRAVRT